jgi:hypothetical protein
VSGVEREYTTKSKEIFICAKVSIDVEIEQKLKSKTNRREPTARRQTKSVALHTVFEGA